MRKWFLAIPILALLMIGLTACGGDDTESENSQTYQVGILNPIAVFDPAIEGLKDGVTELGFPEGEKVTYVYNGPVDAFEVDELAQEAQTLVDAGVDVIVTFATPGGLAAQQVTDEIPVVFGFVTDPVGAGLVSEWRKPEGNLTGTSNANPEVQELRYLLETASDIEQVYIPLNENNQPSVATLDILQEAAGELGVELVVVPADSEAEIQQAVADAPDTIDAIFIMPDVLTADVDYEPLWSQLAEERSIPISYPGGAGQDTAVMTYGSEMYPSGHQLAHLVTQILEGTPAGDLPVEQDEFQLTVYLVNAERYGVNVPDNLLRQADTIIRE